MWVTVTRVSAPSPGIKDGLSAAPAETHCAPHVPTCQASSPLASCRLDVITTSFAPNSGVLSTMAVCDAPKTTSEVGEELPAHEGHGRARYLPVIQARCVCVGHAGPVPSGPLSASSWVCRLLSDLVVPGMCV